LTRIRKKAVNYYRPAGQAEEPPPTRERKMSKGYSTKTDADGSITTMRSGVMVANHDTIEQVNEYLFSLGVEAYFDETGGTAWVRTPERGDEW
jgi:hypothetical protein